MITFPNCKINLGLRIINKRDDNYHNIETVFYPLSFCDILEVIPSAKKELSFTNSGLLIDGNKEDNLCIKAYQLLKKDFPDLPVIEFQLHKNIPAGAGLGGGSADAAYMLQLLNKRFNLGLSEAALINYALQLGSDCPFFIINKPCIATSRGEKLSVIRIDLSSYTFVLINPRIMVHTGKAFSMITPAAPVKSVKDIIQQPITTWKNELINDFEPAVFTQYPAIKKIKDELYERGALYASLSGSGSTVYGIFEKNNIPDLSFAHDYFVKQLVG